jgi:predicted HTH transcriptional regulator
VAEKSIIDGLVGNPSESLNVELKRWIDPTKVHGEEKVAKGVLALRNRNGGYFVVGFDNDTLNPDNLNEPPNPKILFHVDVIQAIVSRYASEAFEIEVSWGEREGKEYPVIIVPPGLRHPLQRNAISWTARDRLSNSAPCTAAH